MVNQALAACCGCSRKSEELHEGSNEPLGKIGTASAHSWADLYVEGNTPETTAKMVKAGGAVALASLYGSDSRLGIRSSSVCDRHEQFGENRHPEPPFNSWWSLFFECFKDPILLILIAAAIVSLAVGIYEHGGETGWIDGVAILMAVAIVATVTASNDYNKQLQFRRLSKESEAGVMLRAIREGAEVAIRAEDVVVGDILQIDTGARLPADAILLTGSDFKTNESALTGESDEVAKMPALPGEELRAAVEAHAAAEARLKAAQEAAEAAARRGAPQAELASLQAAAHALEVTRRKHGPDCVLLGGTTVTSGTGRILAVAVGSRSLQGKIMAATASESGDTPLQEKLDSLATKIGKVGMAAAVATFAAMMVIKLTGGGTSAEVSWPSWFVSAFIYAVTIVVVAIPEGLPLAVTISLAYSTGKMLAEKNLIRHLEACETMGNATDICTDKTGTLTENLMTVVETWLGGMQFCNLSFDSSPAAQAQGQGYPLSAMPPQLADLLSQQLSLNSTAAVIYKSEANGVKEEVKGSKTEGAGLKLVNLLRGFRTPSAAEVKAKAGGSVNLMPYEAIRSSAIDSGRVLKQFAFSSERKMMSTIVRQTDGSTIIYTTGGSDFVLARCTAQLKASVAGVASVPLSEADKADITAGVITAMAKKSLRTIAVAFRSFPAGVDVPAALLEHPEADLTLYCILGIKDPLRRGVKEAVEKCTMAGVRVRMVTGDNKITATAIAQECGILRSERDVVMEGPAFRALQPKELDMVLPRLRVLARSSPNDKMILVRRLNGNLPKTKEEWTKEHGSKGLNWEEHRDTTLPGYYDEWAASRKVPGGIARCVVGVTGDGTNDAPALKYSDVGLAMGIAGTEVAKEACDIIITDDNFASIVNSIKWGRSVYDNVRCFLQFQLTVNVVALLLTFVSAVMQAEPPLNPVMMLWVNLIMDTMGALALATQTPSDELLLRKPYAASAFLVSPKMWRHVLVQATFQLVTLLIVLKAFPGNAGITPAWLNEQGLYLSPGGARASDVEHYTATFIFNIFVFCQIFNEFNARSLDDRRNVFRGLARDATFIAIILISASVQAILVQQGGSFVKSTGLTATHWLLSLLISAFTVPLGVAMRLVPVADREADFAHHYIDAWEARQTAAATLPPSLLSRSEPSKAPQGQASVSVRSPLRTQSQQQLQLQARLEARMHSPRASPSSLQDRDVRVAVAGAAPAASAADAPYGALAASPTPSPASASHRVPGLTIPAAESDAPAESENSLSTASGPTPSASASWPAFAGAGSVAAAFSNPLGPHAVAALYAASSGAEAAAASHSHSHRASLLASAH